MCVDEGGVGERREAQLADADAPFNGGEVCLGGVDMVDTHAVAYEVENVFRPARSHGGEREQEEGTEDEGSFSHGGVV